MEIARKGHLDIDRDFYIVYSTEYNKLSGAQKKPEWDICCIRLFPWFFAVKCISLARSLKAGSHRLLIEVHFRCMFYVDTVVIELLYKKEFS